MSAINATTENLSEILSGDDVVLASKVVPAAVSRARRSPFFESESGKRLIEGSVNLVKAVFPPLLGMLLFVALWALIANTNKSIPGPVETWGSAVELFPTPSMTKAPTTKASAGTSSIHCIASALALARQPSSAFRSAS